MHAPLMLWHHMRYFEAHRRSYTTAIPVWGWDEGKPKQQRCLRSGVHWVRVSRAFMYSTQLSCDQHDIIASYPQLLAPWTDNGNCHIGCVYLHSFRCSGSQTAACNRHISTEPSAGTSLFGFSKGPQKASNVASSALACWTWIILASEQRQTVWSAALDENRQGKNAFKIRVWYWNATRILETLNFIRYPVHFVTSSLIYIAANEILA